MINTSELFSSKIAESTRLFSARLMCGTEEISGAIRSVQITSGACGEGNFTVGAVFSSYIEVVIDEYEDVLEDKEVLLQMGLLVDDETIEYVDIGYYTVTKPKSSAYSTTFTAVGRITSKLNELFDAPEVLTLRNIANAITAKTGVAIIFNGEVSDDVLAKDITGLTCKEVLSVIAGTFGGFATEDNFGNIVVSKYNTDSKIPVNGDRMTALPEFNDLDYDLHGIKVIVSAASETEDGEAIEEVAFTEGTPRLTMTNEFMTAELFESFVANTVGYKYRPGTVPLALGDPRLQPWDCLEVTDVKGNVHIIPCLNIVHTFDGGLATAITAPGESESESSSSVAGPLMQQMERLNALLITAQEAIFKRLKTDELEAKIANLGVASIKELNAINADISNLKAKDVEIEGTLTAAKAEITDLRSKSITAENLSAAVASLGYATVNQLKVTDGKIDNLTAKAITTDNLEANIADFGFITADNLSANFATIDLANVKAGSITQAMIGDGVVGSMQIADGSITDAKIVELAANKITAGTLSVERLEIRGSSNSLVYALNDITGALQAQSVDTLNGEILTPRTITADRIVAGSITAEEIAVNAITANKILAGAITTEKIDAYAVTAGKIAVGAVTAETIYAGSVTAEKIDVDTLSAISANLGTITAGVLQSENYQESNYSVDDEGNATSPVLSGLKIDLNNTAYYTPQITIKDNYINLNGYMTIGQRVLDKNIYPGVYSFVQGKGCEAAGYCSHAEGGYTLAIGPTSHAEGYNTIAGTKAPGFEGYLGAHAEGVNTQALYSGSHSEGYNTMALAEYAHVEGNGCTASGSASHAEGYNCITRGKYSHVEGKNCTAYNEASHVEGIDNEEKESFGANHIEGEKNVVRMSADSYAKATHVGGIGNIGYGGWAQRIIGRYNIIDYTPHSGNPYGDYVLIVGNGTSDTSRSNAHMLDWNGNAWFAGNVTVGASKKQLATTDHTHSNYVDLTSAQTITGAKTFNSSNVFNGEQKFSNASYCPTITDSASGVGCAFKASRGLFNEALIDKLIMTSSTAKIPFYKYTGTSGGSMTGLTEVASISNGGALSCIGEISTTSANAFRSKQGNYGFFIRNDGANVYFMLTDSGNSGGNWNSLRPFTVNCSTGNTSVGHAFDVGGITTVAARIQPKSTVTTVNLGYNDVANHRWANIYSKTSVNVSSDIRVKTDINEIDERYIQLFDLIQPYSYKFIDGTSGRTHTGFISQYVEEALYQVRLESTDLAFFCKDPMFEEIFDNSGNVVGTKPVLDENGDQVYFYSLRYEEYIAIMTAKIKKLEKSIQRQAGELEIVKSKQESTEMKFIAAMMKVAELEKNIERLKLAS